jgi:hypothetical protein
MNSGDLYTAFRSDVVDIEQPYLWTDSEVYRYMDDAYRTFVRETGGVPDVSSALTQIPIVAGAAFADISPLVLKFRQAYLVSTGKALSIVNDADIPNAVTADYGQLRNVLNDTRRGEVGYMVVGMERDKVKWLPTPAANDTVQLSVYRLPLDSITEGDEFFEFPDIGAEHVEYLLLHMKARAYGKQDAETFDRGRRDVYKQEFAEYCSKATAEWERYKSKVRVTRYGGI